MSALSAAGNATPTRSSAARGRACALTASSCTWRSMTRPAPRGQASACKPETTGPCRPLAPCYRRASAHRPLAVPRCESLHSSAIPEPSPRRRSTPASTPLALFPNPGGLTMERTAQEFFYDRVKFVPVDGFAQSGGEKSECVGNPLINRTYTLCEVD